MLDTVSKIDLSHVSVGFHLFVPFIMKREKNGARERMKITKEELRVIPLLYRAITKFSL